MVQRIALSEAQIELKQLVDAAIRGETVVIVGDDQQAVQLVPIASGKRSRKAGSAKGQIIFADDFDAPLPDFDELQAPREHLVTQPETATKKQLESPLQWATGCASRGF